MGFPFLAPLSPWIIEILEERENDTFNTSFRNPYAILTSGALVVKGDAKSDEKDRAEELKKLIADPGNNSYKGCIISNNSNDINLSYQLNESIIGIDFTGKPIIVTGETGRKVSTPIIESVEIDTDGANNTLKSVKVHVICFTLKQLEMFELFFMKPGMNVLFEWGDSFLLKSNFNTSKLQNNPQNKKRTLNTFKDGETVNFTPYKIPEEALVINNLGSQTGDLYNIFCNTFSDYYRSDTTAIAKYLNRIERSLGTYDLIAGKVLDYNFSINDNGTYQIMLEITQGNQVSLAIPPNPHKSTSKEKTPIVDKNKKPYDQIIELIAADFNLDKSKLEKLLSDIHPEGTNGKWENDWYNFLKINLEQKDTTASQNAYVSLRFVLKILMNYILVGGNVDETFFTFHLPKYHKKNSGNKIEKTQSKNNQTINKEYEILPVISNKYIISSSDEIIFPTKELPNIIGKNNPEKEDSANEIEIDDKNSIDGTINGYNFHEWGDYVVPVINKPLQTYHVDDRIGNALNIFLKYETIVKLWNRSQTRIDFLEGVLGMINQHSYGLFTLIYGLQNENSQPTVVDYKMAPKEIELQNSKETYRFKPTTIKSIVKNFSFNFEMSNLVAGRTLFNSNKFLAEAKAAKSNEKIDNDSLHLPPGAYKSIDNSTFANADGWYSINNVELKKIEGNIKTGLKNSKSGINVNKTNEKNGTTTTADDITKIINDKSVKFILNDGSKKIETLIYKDATFIQNKIVKSQNEATKEGKKKSTLSPIDVSITIDGFSGFRCGQYFNIDGIPEIYNQIGVFQITNTKHSIQKDTGWTTTIEAGFRIVNKKK